MKLYFNPQSRAVIARWMLDECGADYQIVPIDLAMEENKRAAYLKINPAGKLPALVDGEARIFENVAICLYLADRFPEANLAPPIGAARARPLSRADGLLDVPARPRVGRRDARREDGAPARLDRLRDLQDRGRTRARRRPYLLGDQFTAADVMIGSMFIWQRMMGNTSGRPVIDAYVDRLLARPKAIKLSG